MAASVQPKSILKKTQPPLPDSSLLPKPRSDEEKRRLAIAVEHARLLQDQKDVMARNLNSIEDLAELPSSSKPTDEEIDQFTTLVMSFQPSDYDALIEERHAMNRCGYTLCPNPPRKHNAKRPWLRAKGSENWCSDACAKQALYIKAQLDEIPAWERRGGATAPIQLYDENRSTAQAKVATEEEERRKEQRRLALERGEGKVASFKVDGTTTTEILEKTPSRPVTAPELSATSEGDSIEGYRPKGISKKTGVRFKDEDDDDEEDTDWKL